MIEVLPMKGVASVRNARAASFTQIDMTGQKLAVRRLKGREEDGN